MDTVISTMTLRNTKMPWQRSSVSPLTSFDNGTSSIHKKIDCSCSSPCDSSPCFHQVIDHSSTRSTESMESSFSTDSPDQENFYCDEAASRGETETPNTRNDDEEQYDDREGNVLEDSTTSKTDGNVDETNDEEKEKNNNDGTLVLSSSMSFVSSSAPLKHQIYKNRHALFAEPLMLIEQDMKTIEKRIATLINVDDDEEEEAASCEERLHKRKSHLEYERKRIFKEQERWQRRRTHRRQRQVTQEQRERFEFDMIEQLKEQSSGGAGPEEDHELWKDPSLIAQG